MAHSENPVLPSLHTFTEEEELLRDTVRKFSEEMVAPKVREMDESEKMDPSIIQGLFENGVSSWPQFILPHHSSAIAELEADLL